MDASPPWATAMGTAMGLVQLLGMRDAATALSTPKSQHSARTLPILVALPAKHPLAENSLLSPQQLSGEAQIVFNNEMENSFGHWASGITGEEKILCAVNTAQAALELVAAGAGLCILPEACAQAREGVTYVPLTNWHQALYMCILYDKWLEPPVWGFVETLVKVLRRQEAEVL